MRYKLKKRHYENLAARTTLLILLSAALVSCGPLMQKPTMSRYNTNAGLVEEPNIINNGERIPHYKTLYFADGRAMSIKTI
jgi:hypothetical protein